MSTRPETEHEAGGGIGRGLLAMMAIGSGVTVANLYYIQPLLAEIGRTYAVSPSAMGIVATLSQIGFATGMLFFVPLGDIGERRALILAMLGGAVLSLAAAASAPSYWWLAAAMFFVGAFSVSPQMFVPFAAHLSAPERRGSAVGFVMSGLVVGILASRTASGYLAEVAGWPSVFWFGAALTLALAIAIAVSMPRSAGTSRMSYARLLRSLWGLTRDEPVLRESALAGAMMFAAFSAFWSMLTFRLELAPLHYGTRVAGLFGVVGIAGAGAAPVAGRLADRLDPRRNVQLALLVVASAFVVFGAFGHTIPGLIVGIVLLDTGFQGGHVTNLSRLHNMSADARNRLTTVYMVAFFLGGAAGSAAGAYAWQRWQWAGVCAVGLIAPLLATVAMSASERRTADR